MGSVNKVILEFDGQILPDGVFRLEMVWDRSTIESDDVSENWVKKIVMYEAVSDNVLVGMYTYASLLCLKNIYNQIIILNCLQEQ